jgi:hypothetical protein
MAGRPRKKTEEGIIEVKRAVYQNGELTEETDDVETIKVPNFTTEVARLKVHGSITRNLGNFNSVRVECGLELPSLPEMSEIDRVYGICSKFVEDKIEAELNNAMSDRNPNIQEPVIAQNKTTGIRRRITS